MERAKIPVFGRQSQNFNDSKDKRKKSNAWKYKVRNPMLGSIRSELQCLER